MLLCINNLEITVGKMRRNVAAASMAGTSFAAALTGCTPNGDIDMIPGSTTTTTVYEWNDPHMKGHVPPDMSLYFPAYTPDPCTAEQRTEIMEHVETGEPLTAEFLVPNDPTKTESVGARPEGSTAHSGSYALNGLIMRCGGTIVEYA